jgi:hypothetical protein
MTTPSLACGKIHLKNCLACRDGPPGQRASPFVFWPAGVATSSSGPIRGMHACSTSCAAEAICGLLFIVYVRMTASPVSHLPIDRAPDPRSSWQGSLMRPRREAAPRRFCTVRTSDERFRDSHFFARCVRAEPKCASMTRLRYFDKSTCFVETLVPGEHDLGKEGTLLARAW